MNDYSNSGERVQSSLTPYYENSWALYDVKTKRMILNRLLERSDSYLETRVTCNDEGSASINVVCNLTGEVLDTRPCNLKQGSLIFKQHSSLEDLKTAEQVHEYFKTYRHIKVQIHSDCFEILSELSSSATSYVGIVARNMLGKNFSLLSTAELKTQLGINVYRKARHELKTKSLLRDVDTRLKKHLSVVQVHPVLAYKGQSLHVDFSPALRWCQSKA